MEQRKTPYLFKVMVFTLKESHHSILKIWSYKHGIFMQRKKMAFINLLTYIRNDDGTFQDLCEPSFNRRCLHLYTKIMVNVF